MSVLFRLMAVALLLIPFLNGGCTDAADPTFQHAQQEAERDAEDVELSDEAELALLQDWFGEEPEPAEDEEVEEPEPEEIDPDQTVSESDAEDVELVVDEDAPELDIRSVERQEGNHEHYITVKCHDPEVGYTRWNWRTRTRTSRHCDVDLATVAQAVSIEPAVDFRIAPIPRGFRILGDFERGEYELELAAGIRTDEGSVLHEPEAETIEVPALSEALQFAAEGRYLPRSAWDELGLRHRNVDEINLQVRHVPRENLSFWISRSGENADEATSNLVVDADVRVRETEDEMLMSTLSVDDHLAEPKPGLYEISVESEDASATSRLQVTDVNLITKRHEQPGDAAWEDAIDVWAVDMESTEPLMGVDVEAIRPSGATMARCRTDRDGHCLIDLPDDGIDPTPPMALLAEQGEHLTYLKFDDLEIESGIEAADGPAFLHDFSYLATMYGDRDLYRPADEVHVFGALRDPDYTAADPGIPVEVTIRDPEGEVAAEESMETGRAGAFDVSYVLSDAAPTGRWQAELEVGKRTLETYSFHVEEFVPERLEVGVEPVEEIVVADEEPVFEVTAEYLFGAGAEGSEVELNCRLVPIDAAIDEDDYRWGPIEIEESREVIDLSTRQGVIGENDTAEVACPTPDRRPSGPMRVEATVAVAEGGSGRTSHAAADATMVPADVQIGLRTDADSVNTGDDLEIRGKLVDRHGELADKGEVTLEFYNIRRHRSWTRRGYDSDYQLILERTLDVETNDGTFAVENTVADVHHAYLVRARSGASTTDLKIGRRGRLWSFSGRSSRTPNPRRPTEVTIEAPDEIPLGREATVEYTAPFSGRALLSVETEGVVHSEWVDVDAGDNRWSFTVDEDEPNVYVAVFIIRDPNQEGGAFVPERAFGAVSIPLEPSRVEADVAVDAPEEVRPGTPLEIEVDAGFEPGGEPAVATVSAVDEGILQLTNYRTPDPIEAMWNERAPGVATFDTIGWATRLPPDTPSSRYGGGAPTEAEASDGRIMPFEPIALWSGPVEIGDDGRATVKFDVPQYSGRLRVMTSVFGGEEMGSDERDVLVRDPLTVQATFPRQLAEQDVADIPVFVTNLTEKTREIDVEIFAEEHEQPGFDAAFEGGDESVLEFVDGSDRVVELDPGESTTVYFAAEALRPGGGADVTVQVTDDEHSSFEEGTIPLQPRGPTERELHTVSLEDGTYDLTEYLDGWVPTSEESHFFVSAVARPEAFDHLEYLIRYPFGCAEQTLSRARPMVHLPDLVEGIDPQFSRGEDRIRPRVEQGINRMISMQHASGGVGFWPHYRWSTRAYPRITAKTLDFFLQASNQGYSVPSERIESAAEWLGDRVDGSPDDAFEHYVLARAGEPKRNLIREAIDDLPDERSGIEYERAYLLYAALYLAGDRSFEQELRNPEYETSDGGRSQGRFYSHRRQRAMILSVFVELFGRDSNAEELAGRVADDLADESRGRLTTQEIVWAIHGLGTWYRAEGLEEVDVELVTSRRSFRPDYVGGHPTWTVHRASEFEKMDLRVDRNGFEGSLNLMLRSSGVREEPTEKVGGEGLAIERVYLDENGDEIGADEIGLGDVVYAKITLENETSNTHSDLALVDRVPAGFEIENPDLGAAELPSWATTSWDTDNVDVRDDRVEMFGDLSRGEEVEAMVPVRATVPGDYYAAPPEVDGMYNPEVWARGESGEVRIGLPGES